jgi:hypothetical protein
MSSQQASTPPGFARWLVNPLRAYKALVSQHVSFCRF